MQKIYVLLRNDQQTGPYSLEEISQFDLKPYDLIWIEGKSAGWYYPQEIAALHPYLSFLPQKPKPVAQSNATEKKVFVAMPSTPKKEEVPVTLLAEATAPVWKEEATRETEVPRETARPFAPASENLEHAVYAQFMTPPKKEEPALVSNSTSLQKKKSPNAVVVGIAAALIVGGVFAASWVMNRQPSEEENSTENVAPVPVENEVVNAPAATDNNSKHIQVASASKQKTQRSSDIPKTVAVAHRNTPATQVAQTKREQEHVVNSDATKGSDEEATVQIQKAETKPVDENTSAPVETSAPQEKKKKLRDKIFDIFRKKPEEPKVEDAKPTTTENGERQSSHRESGANLAQLVSVRFTVPNDWMMGIKGAKATLVNRSSETITGATVEILYYNDDNELMQKKTVSFGKIGAKDSQTISIPDHATATRVDYTIVSVAGKPAA